MKYLVVILLLPFSSFLFSCNQKSESKKCTDFKSGEFYVKSRSDSSLDFIKRHDTIQVETNSKTGNSVTSKIKWTGECEFELLFQSQTTNSPDSIISFLQDKLVKSKIISVSQSYYIFESRIDNVNFTYTDTVWLGKP